MMPATTQSAPTLPYKEAVIPNTQARCERRTRRCAASPQTSQPSHKRPRLPLPTDGRHRNRGRPAKAESDYVSIAASPGPRPPSRPRRCRRADPRVVPGRRLGQRGRRGRWEGALFRMAPPPPLLRLPSSTPSVPPAGTSTPGTGSRAGGRRPRSADFLAVESETRVQRCTARCNSERMIPSPLGHRRVSATTKTPRTTVSPHDHLGREPSSTCSAASKCKSRPC